MDDELRRDARIDAAMEREPENPCPCCGSELHTQKWYENGYMVETVAHCKCGYSAGWSYGTYEMELPDGFEEVDGEIRAIGEYTEEFENE